VIRAVAIGLVLLVLQVPQAPQALSFWCPMHPDERAASATACPICKMTMVPIPPMRVGEYRIDVSQIRPAKGLGLDGVRLTLRDPTGAAVAALDNVHEKPLHVFIVGNDLVFFRHVHAESVNSGVAEIRTSIPPGEYMLIADFVPTGGVPQLVHRALISPGARPIPSQLPPLWVGGRVRARAVTTAFQAGNEANLRLAITSTVNGQPILDLEPYLGASAHLLLVNEKLTEAVHAHAADFTGAEPVLSFDFTLPVPGTWRGWLQFQREGQVITVPVSVLGR
jgi:hypothetical protein